MTVKQTNKYLADLFKQNVNDVDKLNVVTEKELQKRLIVSYRNVKGRIADMYATFGSDVTFSEMNKYDRLRKIELDILAEMRALGYNTNTMINGALKDSYASTYYRSGFAYESALRTGLTFSALSIDSIRGAIINDYDRIGWKTRNKAHAGKLNQQLSEILSESLINGYGYKKIVREFGERFENYTNNVKRIVQTEMHRIETTARLAAHERAKVGAGKLGIKLIKVWDATLDGHTRADHARLDGVAANEIGEWVFPVTGITTRGPGLSGSKKMDIHCRCSTRGQIAGEPPKTVWDNIEKKTIPYTNFSEWAKGKNIPFNKK